LLKLIIFLPMRQSHVSTATFSLQDGEQDSSIKSMQEVEASTLEIGLHKGWMIHQVQRNYLF
jgi:hypothetical protein